MNEVGHEVRRLRDERGWTQAKLAVEARMAPSAVNQIENGKRAPSARSLAKLAKALDVEVRDLFPKAQAPLPLLEDARRRGVEQAEEMLAAVGPLYTAYDALGVLLADRWRRSLQAFKESPGIRIDTLKAGDCRALLQFTWDVFETTAVYETAAKEARYPQRPGYVAALREIEGVRQEAADTVRPILDYLKTRQDTDAEFRKIWEASNLDALISGAEIR